MKRGTMLVAVALVGAGLATDRHSDGQDPSGPESLLVRTLDAIRAERLDQALQHADSLVRKEPGFRLAHMVRGDILAAQTASGTVLVARNDSEKARIDGLRDEARARLRRYVATPPRDKLPIWLLTPSPRAKMVLVVDSRASRLFVFRQQGMEWRLASDHYVTIGQKGFDKRSEGDFRTPIGAYFLTRRIDDAQLDDYYGIGAWPLDYPNEWDRMLKRTGSGIWVHGTPKGTYSRPPRASSGCVVLTNPDLMNLEAGFVAGATPILVSDTIEWVSPQEVDHRRDGVVDALSSWKKDWSQNDVDRYLSHYSAEFRSEKGAGLVEWERDKRRIFAGKTWVKVELSDVSVLGVPGETDLVQMDFVQNYSSNNLSSSSRKRQYWRIEDGQWRIVWEGSPASGS